MGRTLADIMAELAPTYDPQRQIVAQQQATLPGEEAAAIAGLEATKAQEYRDIDTFVNSRGMTYSGDPARRREEYSAMKFQPALAGVKNDITNRRFKLEEALLGINSNQGNQARDILTSEQKAEAEAAYRAQQLAVEREKIAAQQRAAAVKAQAPAKAQAANPAQQLQTASAQLAQALKSVTGRDGFVSPQSWAQARAEWMAAGYSAADFNARFRGFANLTYGDKALLDYQLK